MGRPLSVSKSLAEFAARRRQRSPIIFSRDMCVRENTAQARSSAILSPWLKIMRAAACKLFVGENEVFSTASIIRYFPAQNNQNS